MLEKNDNPIVVDRVAADNTLTYVCIMPVAKGGLIIYIYMYVVMAIGVG